MDGDKLKNQLENIRPPQFSQLRHQELLKLAILSARKSARISLWLLLAPFLLFFSALLRQLLNISIPPDSWLEANRLQLSPWLRIALFAAVMIVLPLLAVITNLLSVIWLHYEREQKVLQLSIKLRMTNLVIMLVAGFVALLFAIVMIAD